MTEVIIHNWRDAVRQAKLESTTKLVLLNLALYMNAVGESCFPSVEQQAIDCGLSKRSVITHLGLAEAAGFIKKQQHGYGGRRWMRNEYIAAIPAHFALARESRVPVSIPEPEENDDEAVNVVHYLDDEAVQLTTRGGANDSNEAVNVLHPISPENYSITAQCAGAREENHNAETVPLPPDNDFQSFWEKYPAKFRGDKAKARAAWVRVVEGGAVSAQVLCLSVARYAASDDSRGRYATSASKWLENERWSAYLEERAAVQTVEGLVPWMRRLCACGYTAPEIAARFKGGSFDGKVMRFASHWQADNIRLQWGHVVARALGAHVEIIHGVDSS